MMMDNVDVGRGGLVAVEISQPCFEDFPSIKEAHVLAHNWELYALILYVMIKKRTILTDLLSNESGCPNCIYLHLLALLDLGHAGS